MKKLTFVQFLSEEHVDRNDPEMGGYKTAADEQTSNMRQKLDNMREGPYAVGWSGQSFEWYGDEGPETGNGRYKPKGDGGSLVAINVPTIKQAIDISSNLAWKLDKQDLGTPGTDWSYIVNHKVYVVPMSKLDYEQQDEIQSNARDIQDFGVRESMKQPRRGESKEGEISPKETKSDYYFGTRNKKARLAASKKATKK